MDELRVQVNNLYDPPEPSDSQSEGSDEWLISDLAAHLSLAKIPDATVRLV
jgi:hypothetical protein